jgi:hypothetical protein
MHSRYANGTISSYHDFLLGMSNQELFPSGIELGYSRTILDLIIGKHFYLILNNILMIFNFNDFPIFQL